MINAMSDGVAHYQAFTDATAGIVNQQFTKSQVQHRWSWEVLGQKALWILPITHTCLTLLLFGVFPLIIALTTLPGGIRILYGYMQFFMSLQFWPVLFAILNAGMTIYGASSSAEYGQFTMVNLDKIDELHADIEGSCGYLMMLIPFLAHGLVSNLGGAFSNLATSMMSHMQGSSMSVAGEAAAASFGLGQTSFYNTTANNFSANKHDSNWTHMHGMHTEQLESGVLKTLTGSGEAVFDVSPGMTKSHIHIADAKALTGSLNQAYEQSTQTAANESKAYQSALSNFAHRALALAQLSGHDMRLGDGISSSDSAHYSSALSQMSRIAQDVAKRHGISKEDAFAAMTSGGHGISGGVDLQKVWLEKSLALKAGGMLILNTNAHQLMRIVRMRVLTRSFLLKKPRILIKQANMWPNLLKHIILMTVIPRQHRYRTKWELISERLKIEAIATMYHKLALCVLQRPSTMWNQNRSKLQPISIKRFHLLLHRRWVVLIAMNCLHAPEI